MPAFIVIHPVVGMLAFDDYDDAINATDDIGDAYDLNEIGTLKSRCHIMHTPAADAYWAQRS